jgi:hypothetical protein
MSAARKPFACREKELHFAISRIRRGRARTGETKITIASVAREAGVSAALIHNHYPRIAEAIRQSQGCCIRADRDAKRGELKAEREKGRTLRQENVDLRKRIDKLASINEVLLDENRVLRAKRGDQKVVDFKSPRSKNG